MTTLAHDLSLESGLQGLPFRLFVFTSGREYRAGLSRKDAVFMSRGRVWTWDNCSFVWCVMSGFAFPEILPYPSLLCSFFALPSCPPSFPTSFPWWRPLLHHLIIRHNRGKDIGPFSHMTSHRRQRYSTFQLKRLVPASLWCTPSLSRIVWMWNTPQRL